jgi:hypothetical protein
MKKVLRNSGRILLVSIIFIYFSANAWGLGQLKLSAKTEDGKIKISLIEEEGHYFGEIREGFTVLTPVEVFLDAKTLKISIGEQDYIIERWELGKSISYGGIIQDDRGISAQAVFKGRNLTISGTIENDNNDLIDFEATANDQKGSLKLRWNDKYLVLKKLFDEKPGDCQGGLFPDNLAKSSGFRCSSSGSLKDAFFKSPDHILAWLVILFVN